MNLLQRLGLLIIIGIVLATAINHFTRPQAPSDAGHSASQAQ